MKLCNVIIKELHNKIQILVYNANRGYVKENTEVEKDSKSLSLK